MSRFDSNENKIRFLKFIVYLSVLLCECSQDLPIQLYYLEVTGNLNFRIN